MLYFFFHNWNFRKIDQRISEFWGEKHQTDPLFIFVHIMGRLSDEVTSIIIIFLFLCDNRVISHFHV